MKMITKLEELVDKMIARGMAKADVEAFLASQPTYCNICDVVRRADQFEPEFRGCKRCREQGRVAPLHAVVGVSGRVQRVGGG